MLAYDVTTSVDQYRMISVNEQIEKGKRLRTSKYANLTMPHGLQCPQHKHIIFFGHITVTSTAVPPQKNVPLPGKSC